MTAFCIVSSDSDYTRLAMRVREQGLSIVGMGEKKTPKALVSACNVFVYLENLTPKPPSTADELPPASQAATTVESPADVRLLVEEALEMTAGDDGWANLGAVGNQLRSLDPSFDCRTYGHRRLVDLLRSLGRFDIRQSNPGGPGTVYVRRSQ